MGGIRIQGESWFTEPIVGATRIVDALELDDFVVPTREGFVVAARSDGFMGDKEWVQQSRLLIDDGNTLDPRTPEQFVTELDGYNKPEDRMTDVDLRVLANGVKIAIGVAIQSREQPDTPTVGIEGDIQ